MGIIPRVPSSLPFFGHAPYGSLERNTGDILSGSSRVRPNSVVDELQATRVTY